MHYDWDETKNRINKANHGIAFQEMARFDWGFAICLDAQIVGFEERELWIGPIAAALFAVVTVERNEDALRIVSLRQASRLEKSEWRKEFHHG